MLAWNLSSELAEPALRALFPNWAIALDRKRLHSSALGASV